MADGSLVFRLLDPFYFANYSQCLIFSLIQYGLCSYMTELPDSFAWGANTDTLTHFLTEGKSPHTHTQYMVNICFSLQMTIKRLPEHGLNILPPYLVTAHTHTHTNSNHIHRKRKPSHMDDITYIVECSFYIMLTWEAIESKVSYFVGFLSKTKTACV